MIKDIQGENGEIKLTIWDGTAWKDKSVDEETKAFLEAYKKKHPRNKLPEYTDIYGELFAIRYLPHLTKTSTRIELKKVLDPIEGKDFISFDLMGRNGNVEIKTIKNYLTRDDTPQNNPNTKGTIPFEIFHNWPQKGKEKDTEELEKLYAGWLLSAYNYIEYNKIKEDKGRPERAEHPGLYVYVLLGSNNKPFACVVFEDIRATLERLYEICPDPSNWGIPDPRTLKPATEQEYWAQYNARKHFNKAYGGMINNVWHVPFESLYKLATVTMINNIVPEAEVKASWGRCKPEVAEARYKNLKWVAEQEGREKCFDPDAWTEEENKRIEKLEANGAQVSKRNYVSLNASELEKLENGISVTTDGRITEMSASEREMLKKAISDIRDGEKKRKVENGF